MKVEYTVKISQEIDEAYLGEQTPEEYIKEGFENDPSFMLEGAEIVNIKVNKVTKGEDTEADDDLDGLNEVDEDELLDEENL